MKVLKYMEHDKALCDFDFDSSDILYSLST